MKALIDADIILYSSGFSAEKPIYRVILNETDKISATFRYKKEVLEWASFVGIGEDEYDAVKDVEVEPVAHALNNAKQLIRRILLRTGATKHQLYLTGKGNFREDIATLKPYKGNRDSNHKPHHYDSIKKYLMENWGAVVVEGIEADDAMSIAQVQGDGNTVICTIDKDLNTTPGIHYNWNQDVVYLVSEEDASTWFYCQMIIGDSTDNIPGIPGSGKKKAYNLFSKCDTVEDMYWATLDMYCNSYERPMEALIENARLLYMQREEGEMWIPPV